jgi:hypothetical protein
MNINTAKSVKKKLPFKHEVVLHVIFKSKEAYQWCKHQINSEVVDQVIELNELYEFLLEILNMFEKEFENQENVKNYKFRFSCNVNIVALEGDSKEKANHIIK